jgi:hypothetical protein
MGRRKIKVSNLAYECRGSDLKDHFYRCGHIVRVKKDRREATIVSVCVPFALSDGPDWNIGFRSLDSGFGFGLGTGKGFLDSPSPFRLLNLLAELVKPSRNTMSTVEFLTLALASWAGT